MTAHTPILHYPFRCSLFFSSIWKSYYLILSSIGQFCWIEHWDNWIHVKDQYFMYYVYSLIFYLVWFFYDRLSVMIFERLCDCWELYLLICQWGRYPPSQLVVDRKDTNAKMRNFGQWVPLLWELLLLIIWKIITNYFDNNEAIILTFEVELLLCLILLIVVIMFLRMSWNASSNLMIYYYYLLLLFVILLNMK